MRVPARVKEAQERLAYRLAVRACLEIFDGQSIAESQANADAWWERLSKSSAFKSGFFMHPEPINTAGEIADSPIIELNERNAGAYARLLDDCWKHARDAGGLDEQVHLMTGEAVTASGVGIQGDSGTVLRAWRLGSSAAVGRKQRQK